MIPSWKDAPEWANWLAQDEDGSWWWFEVKPRCGLSHWELSEENTNYSYAGGGVSFYEVEQFGQHLQER